MNTVQFEPKITTELQVDWRRQNAGAGADMFTDLLADQMKRRTDGDPQDDDARRLELSRPRRHASDPLSGRPARLTIAHPKTLRGEAREVDESAERLPDRPTGQSDCAPDKDAAKATDDVTESSAAAAGKTADEVVETDTAPTDEQPAQAADGKQQATDVAATVVVAVQPTDQKAADCAQEAADAILTAPTPADGETVPAAQGQAADAKDAATDPQDAAAGENPANAGGTPEQPVAEAAVAADLSAALAMMNAGDGTPVDAAVPSGTAPQGAAGTPIANKQPMSPLGQASLPDPTPPIQPQAAPRAIDTKLRATTSTRANAGAPDPSPSPAKTQQSASPHPTAAVQPLTASETDGSDELSDQSLSADNGGPGWTLHLAQGAGGKRADFIAQLKQHLQNLPAHEQVAIHIQRALREGTGKFSIQLSPAELGRIQVKLEIDEEKRVTATVTVERPSTLELLQRDVKGLERALHDAGLTMEGGDLSFSLSQGSDRDFAQDLNQSAASVAGGAASDAQVDGDQPDSRVAQVMDTAAGIVNLQV